MSSPAIDFEPLGAWSEPLAAAIPLPARRRERIYGHLRRLGLSGEEVHRIEAIRALAALTALFIGGALVLLVPVAFEMPAVLLLVSTVLGGLRLPEEWLAWQADRHVSRLERQLAHVWERLTHADSGLAPQLVLEGIARELELSDLVVSRELSRLSVHVRLEGVAAGAARWASRFESHDIDCCARRLADWERRGCV